MNLRDAMARAMLERAVKHPGCPPSVLRAWKDYWETWEKRGGHWLAYPNKYSGLWNGVMDQFEAHLEEISEILCTENGQIDGQNSGPETNDARKK